jgi:endo-1,4-beta-xylanase
MRTPEIITLARTPRSTERGRLVFRPHYTQRGRGPHLETRWLHCTDENWDTFPSNITVATDGVAVSDLEGRERFGINVRWNVEGFGMVFMTADNAGRMYTLPEAGREEVLNLNYELARSRVARNRRRRNGFAMDGWRPDRETAAYLDLSEGHLEDAATAGAEEARARFSQEALRYALHGGEMMEMSKVRFDIERNGRRDNFLFGCDARSFYQMYQDTFLERFTPLFNYALITYIWQGDGIIKDFEPVEGERRWEIRDVLFDEMRRNDIQVMGRPLFWFHTWVTPDWIKQKSYEELLKYVESHTRAVVSHYGDRIYGWEIVNEFHDWANEVGVTPEQAVELTKLACDVAKDTNPNVHRMINNCCSFAEYVQMREWSGQPARYRQRTPWQFMKDLHDAGVDFTISGLQMYFPYRDLQDTFIMTERFAEFGRPVQLTEIGFPGGPTERSVKLGQVPIKQEPPVWRRGFDEDLQADWLEALFSFGYSKSYVEGVAWFDFVDPHYYIENGGLLRNPQGEPKTSWTRLRDLREQFATLPDRPRPQSGCRSCQ